MLLNYNNNILIKITAIHGNASICTIAISLEETSRKYHFESI